MCNWNISSLKIIVKRQSLVNVSLERAGKLKIYWNVKHNVFFFSNADWLIRESIIVRIITLKWLKCSLKSVHYRHLAGPAEFIFWSSVPIPAPPARSTFQTIPGPNQKRKKCWGVLKKKMLNTYRWIVYF